LIVVDPSKRLTAAEAAKHKWLAEEDKNPTPTDLLPGVRKGFDATKTFKKAVGVVQAAYKLSNNNLNSAKNSSESLNELVKSESNDSLAQAVTKF
jgi:serine/threonine protein kinase